jgi:hypothetical protein
MSPVALGLDGLLITLLVAALALGLRLNARLKGLKDGQSEFAKAAQELNQAVNRAEAGLAALRQATEEAHDSLLARIETARDLTAKLDHANRDAQRMLDQHAEAKVRAPGLPTAVGQGDDGASLVERLAALALKVNPPGCETANARAAANARRGRSAFDEDLFEGENSR